MTLPFLPEKFVLPVLISVPQLRTELESLLEDRFGPIDYSSPDMDFTYTHYYDREMGHPIRRFFLSFERLVDPGRLSTIKNETGAIEDHFRESGKRKINLDPGLVALSRFVLASRKEASHRICLSDGIYAEIALLFEGGEFRPVEWTYPDYQSAAYRQILKEIRSIYSLQLKAPRLNPSL